MKSIAGKLAGATAMIAALTALVPFSALADQTPSELNPIVPTQPSGPFTIAYKFAVGQVKKYAVSSDVNMVFSSNSQAPAGVPQKPMNVHVDMTQTTTVTTVDPATGDATEQEVLSGINMLINGQTAPDSLVHQVGGMGAAKLVIAPNGAMVSLATPAKGPQLPNGFNPATFGTISFLPTKPVEIGDSWTANVPLPSIGSIITTHLTLKRVYMLGGDRMAEVDGTFSSTPAAVDGANVSAVSKMNMSMSGNMTEIFDLDKGELASSTGDTTMLSSQPPTTSAAGASSAGFGMTTDMKLEMNLLPTSPTP